MGEAEKKRECVDGIERVLGWLLSFGFRWICLLGVRTIEGVR